MAGGVNHAKKIVIDQANDLADKLENGKSDCVETQGKAIALIVKMLSPLYEAEFVTIEECKKQHENFRKEKAMKIKIGPVGLEGNLPPIIILCLVLMSCFGSLIFVIGKTQSWW